MAVIPLGVHPVLSNRAPLSLGFSRRCLDFDKASGQYVHIVSPAAMAWGTGAFYARCLVYVPSHDATLRFILGANTPESTSAYFLYLDGGNLLRWIVRDALAAGIGTVSDAVFPTGRWVHVYVHRTAAAANDVEIWIDGTKQAVVGATADGNFTGPNHVRFSCDPSSVRDYLDGKMDEIVIDDGNLTQKQIEQDMLNYHKPVNKATLSGWWRLEEGTGLVAEDTSGNNNDGDLLPALTPPTWTDVRKWELRQQVGL